TAIAAGRYHSLALLSDGTVATWGSNQFDQLGYETPGAGADSAGVVPGLVNVVAIASAGDTSYALRSDGTLVAWGANDAGQLGDPETTADSSVFRVQVASLGNGVVALGAGATASHMLALANPVVALSPTTMDFGASRRGFDSPVKTLTVTNTGAGGLSGISTHFYSGDFQDFFPARNTDTCMGAVLAHGASCQQGWIFHTEKPEDEVSTTPAQIFTSAAPSDGIPITFRGVSAEPPELVTDPEVTGYDRVEFHFADFRHIAPVGRTLSCSPGTWTGHPTEYQYAWVREVGGAIPGETGSTYTVTAADVGSRIACFVRAVGGGGSSVNAYNSSYTLAVLPLAVHTLAVDQITDTGATLNGVVEGLAHWQFRVGFGYSAEYDMVPPLGDLTWGGDANTGGAITVSTRIRRLEPNTTYHFTLSADLDGTSVQGEDVTFKTHLRPGERIPPGDDVDFSWLKPEQSLAGSRANIDLRRAAVLLHAACTLPPLQSYVKLEDGRIEDSGPGDGSIAKLVGRAALLRLIERDPLAVRVAMGVPGARWTGPAGTVLGPMVLAYESYGVCLDQLAPGWEHGVPQTLPGWSTVVDYLLTIPPSWLPPGTDKATDLPGCGRRHGNGDPIQAMVLRVWGMMRSDSLFSAIQALRPNLPDAVSNRAWLDGNALPIDVGFCTVITESENHTWLIRTSRYLHNDMHLLPIRSANSSAVRDFDAFPPNFDNNANGVNAYIRRITSHWMESDFNEYNARNYSDYQMIGLMNLFDFSSETAIKNRAHEVMDFLSVKQAAESMDRARIAPYRRLAEKDSDYLLDGDPLASMYQIWVGGLTQVSAMPGHMEEEMTLAASSTYTPPDVLIDRMLRPARRTFFER
ncbi:MAG: hypothetical protein QOH17_1849, partial [Pseudonocardiales bacterium]|nr:hypothetical protein [Pseudonocardiales bacterium]